MSNINHGSHDIPNGGRARIADCVYLGTLALSLTVLSGIVLFKWRPPGGGTIDQLAMFMWIFGAPGLALINLWFAKRDAARGKRFQARLGVILSGICVLLGWGSLLLAD